MKINNFKRASAALLASLNVGSVFAQGEIVERNHSNFKKQEQTKKSSFVDLPQIFASAVGGGILFVVMDEFVVRPLVGLVFGKKNESTATRTENKNIETKSKFKDEKDIINSTFEYLKQYSSDKAVNDYLEAFKNFGLKLCDCNFDKDAKNITFQSLMNIGLKELLNVIVQYSVHFCGYKIGSVQDLIDEMGLLCDAELKIAERFPACDVLVQVAKQLRMNSRATGEYDWGMSLFNWDTSLIAMINQRAIDGMFDAVACIYLIDATQNIENDIDELCEALLPVITGNNKDNLGDSADNFFTDEKYTKIKTIAMKCLSMYTTCTEKRFQELAVTYKYKDVRSCISTIFELCRDELKEDYKPVQENIKEYLEQKLRELELS